MQAPPRRPIESPLQPMSLLATGEEDESCQLIIPTKPKTKERPRGGWLTAAEEVAGRVVEESTGLAVEVIAVT